MFLTCTLVYVGIEKLFDDEDLVLKKEEDVTTSKSGVSSTRKMCTLLSRLPHGILHVPPL